MFTTDAEKGQSQGQKPELTEVAEASTVPNCSGRPRRFLDDHSLWSRLVSALRFARCRAGVGHCADRISVVRFHNLQQGGGTGYQPSTSSCAVGDAADFRRGLSASADK